MGFDKRGDIVEEAQSPITFCSAIIGLGFRASLRVKGNKKPAHPVWMAGRFAYENRASTKSQTVQSGVCFLLFFLVSAIGEKFIGYFVFA